MNKKEKVFKLDYNVEYDSFELFTQEDEGWVFHKTFVCKDDYIHYSILQEMEYLQSLGYRFVAR